MKFNLSALILLLTTILFVPASAQAESVWLTNTVDYGFTDNWQLAFEQEFKSEDGSWTDAREHSYALGINRLFENSSLGFSYKWVEEDGHEDRFRVDYSWNPPLNENESLFFMSRVRGEFRMFDGTLPDEFRIRYRAGLQGVIHAGSVDIEPWVHAEAFWGSEHDNIYKYRYAIGTNVEFTDHVEWYVGYLVEDEDGDTREVVVTGLNLSF